MPRWGNGRRTARAILFFMVTVGAGVGVVVIILTILNPLTSTPTWAIVLKQAISMDVFEECKMDCWGKLVAVEFCR